MKPLEPVHVQNTLQKLEADSDEETPGNGVLICAGQKRRSNWNESILRPMDSLAALAARTARNTVFPRSVDYLALNSCITIHAAYMQPTCISNNRRYLLPTGLTSHS